VSTRDNNEELGKLLEKIDIHVHGGYLFIYFGFLGLKKIGKECFQVQEIP